MRAGKTLVYLVTLRICSDAKKVVNQRRFPSRFYIADAKQTFAYTHDTHHLKHFRTFAPGIVAIKIIALEQPLARLIF